MDVYAELDRLSKGAEYIALVAREIHDWIEKSPDKGDATTVAKLLFKLKTVHKEVDTATKALYNAKDRLEKSTLPEILRTIEQDLFRVPEISRSFSLQTRISASLLDKERGFAWLQKMGQGDLIQETVNAGTLSSYVKSLIDDEGIEPPDDIVKVSTYNTININKYTPPKGAGLRGR